MHNIYPTEDLLILLYSICKHIKSVTEVKD